GGPDIGRPLLRSSLPRPPFLRSSVPPVLPRNGGRAVVVYCGDDLDCLRCRGAGYDLACLSIEGRLCWLRLATTDHGRDAIDGRWRGFVGRLTLQRVRLSVAHGQDIGRTILNSSLPRP